MLNNLKGIIINFNEHTSDVLFKLHKLISKIGICKVDWKRNQIIKLNVEEKRILKFIP